MRKLILSLATAFVGIGFTQSINSQDWDQWRGPGHQGLIPASYNSQSQNASDPAAESSLVVLAFKWNKSRQTVAKTAPESVAPAAAVTRADINYERSKRANDPPGATDPRTLTVDARSAALEKTVQESRSSGAKTVDGFEHRVKVRNSGAKVVEIVFWEYQFTESLNPANVIRRQFICGVEMKPNKEKELLAFSSANPGAVISVGSLANKSGNPFKEQVVINRVEYADGSIYQRKDWNFAEVRSAITRAVATPWGAEMCRSL
ncbi:MAG: hypothetical protein ACR2LM_07860 [Pyrinomonadaceae bacterium]